MSSRAVELGLPRKLSSHWTLLARLRGALAISAAKAWFLVIGLLQTVLLPAVMGQAGFGTYKRALAFVNVLNAVVVVGSLQAVSRAVSRASTAQRRGTVRRLLPLHAATAVTLGAAFGLLAPVISSTQHAPQLLMPLRVLSAVVIAYGLYAPLVGALNGLGHFGHQAFLDVTASTLRTILSVGLAAWFVRHPPAIELGGAAGDGSAVGASLGFLCSCLLLIPLAWWLLRRALDGIERGTAAASVDIRGSDYLRGLFGLLLLQVLQSLLLQFDVMVIGRAATLNFRSAGEDLALAARMGDRVAGVYAQAQAFGLVPFQLLLAATHVLFPAVAEAHAKGDRATLQRRVRSGGRVALLVGGALVAAMAGAPEAVLRVAFGSVPRLPGGAAEMAAHVLRMLTLAHLATAVASLGITLLAAAGQFKRALLGSAALTTLAAGGVLVGAWSATESVQLPERVALGLMLGLFVGAAGTVAIVHRGLGRLVGGRDLARVLVALVVAGYVGLWTARPVGRLMSVFVPIVPLLVFVGMCWLLGATRERVESTPKNAH